MNTHAIVRRLLILTSCAAAILVIGCASPAQRIAPERLPIDRYHATWDNHLAAATTTQQRMAHPEWAAIVHAASQSRAVLIGEVHTHKPGLDAAARLFEDIIAYRASSSAQPALALEFLERDQQTALDDYLKGVINLETFRQRTNRTDKNYYGHQDMVEAARAANLPVAAANAPRRYVRLARQQGPDAIKALTPEQQRHIVLADQLADAGYAQRFGNLMAGMAASHSENPQAESSPPTDPLADPTIRSFYLAQNIWDATMADSVAQLVQAGSRPTVLVVGQFHTDHDGGLTRRLRARLGNQSVFTISMIAEYPPAEHPPAASTNPNAHRADAIIYTGPNEETE